MEVNRKLYEITTINLIDLTLIYVRYKL